MALTGVLRCLSIAVRRLVLGRADAGFQPMKKASKVRRLSACGRRKKREAHACRTFSPLKQGKGLRARLYIAVATYLAKWGFWPPPFGKTPAHRQGLAAPVRPCLKAVPPFKIPDQRSASLGTGYNQRLCYTRKKLPPLEPATLKMWHCWDCRMASANLTHHRYSW